MGSPEVVKTLRGESVWLEKDWRVIGMRLVRETGQTIQNLVCTGKGLSFPHSKCDEKLFGGLDFIYIQS